jgi:hypothetical protein
MIIAKLKVSLHLLTQGKWRVAGVVPFDHQSGTSVKYKSKVSIYADKELKSILHLAAMSAIRLIMNLEYIT